MGFTRMFTANRRLGVLMLLCVSTVAHAAQLKQQTIDEWNGYLRGAQAQMDRRLSGQTSFLWLDSVPDGRRRARNGEILVAPFDEHTPKHVSDGLIHHWIGASFIPGVRIKDILSVVRDYPRYKEFYKPLVIESAVDAGQPISANGDDEYFIRFWNEAALSKTAFDATYTASWVQLDSHRCYEVAHTTRLQEVDHYDEPTQRRLPPDQGNGYIWRLYSTTRFAEADDGVYIEEEAIGLSRDIPTALRWFVDPIVRRVSRDALSTSLLQTGQAVHTVTAQNGKAGERILPIAPFASASTH